MLDTIHNGKIWRKAGLLIMLFLPTVPIWAGLNPKIVEVGWEKDCVQDGDSVNLQITIMDGTETEVVANVRVHAVGSKINVYEESHTFSESSGDTGADSTFDVEFDTDANSVSADQYQTEARIGEGDWISGGKLWVIHVDFEDFDDGQLQEPWEVPYTYGSSDGSEWQYAKVDLQPENAPIIIKISDDDDDKFEVEYPYNDDRVRVRAKSDDEREPGEEGTIEVWCKDEYGDATHHLDTFDHTVRSEIIAVNLWLEP